jgi:hypothetical protein
MGVKDKRIRRLIPAATVVALVVSALFGQSVHLLQHTAIAGTPTARTCACVHDPAGSVPGFAPGSSGDDTPPPSNSDHDPTTCSICLTFLLQTLPVQHAPELHVLPIEIRRILPQNVIGGGQLWSPAAARGPPCE